MAFGGQGIIRQEGLVVFVPFTAPGDVVRYKITQKKKNFAFGESLKVLEPSGERAKPLCPYFGTCGGCQLQHLKYTAQLDMKRQWVEDALKRQAGLVIGDAVKINPAQLQWSYRRRISMRLQPHDGHFQAGYTTNDNKTLITVTQCPIFTYPDDPIIEIVQKLAKKLVPTIPTDGRVIILKDNEGGYLLHFHFKALPENSSDVMKKTSSIHPEIKGILATSPRQTISFGHMQTSFEIEGLKFTLSPQAFIQNHPEQSHQIYSTIMTATEGLKKGKALDLYSGIGITSLMLARQGFHVTGIELNRNAVQLAADNAAQNAIKAKFLAGDVAALLPPILKSERPNLTIVNPPREGLDPAVILALKQNPPQTLIYVSCMPSTLARDLKKLCYHENPYFLKTAEAFDMFPQTAHVETLVVLEQKM